MSSSQLKLNLIEGSVAFSFSVQSAKELQATLTALITRLKAVATQSTPGSKPTPKASMEYRHTGDVFLEIFCNPNIWSTPFAAKVLITLRDDRIRLTTEAELTRLIEDVNEFIEQQS